MYGGMQTLKIENGIEDTYDIFTRAAGLDVFAGRLKVGVVGRAKSSRLGVRSPNAAGRI